MDLAEWADGPNGDHPENGVFDSSGEWVAPELITAGHAEEIRWLQKENVWQVVPVQQCWDATGKPPITCRWVEKL